MSVAEALARVAELERRLMTPAPPASEVGDSFATMLGAVASPAGVSPVQPAGEGDVPYASLIDGAAARHGLDPALLRGLVRQESGFDASAVSHAGARGLTQLMPGTAAALGVTDPTDPAQALDGGARYLRELLDRFGGDTSKALAGYNAGPGAVQRYGGIPPYAETRAYVTNVLAYADAYRSGAASPLAA